MPAGRTALTTRGKCLLAAGLAGAACAGILDERDLLRVAVFAAVVPLVALLYARLLRGGLTAQRELRADRVAAGEEVPVRLHLGGRRGLRSGEVLLQDTVPEALGSAPWITPASRRRPGTTLEYTIPSPLRGAHTLGPLRCSVGDPLGLACSRTSVGTTSRLLVVPTLRALPAALPRDGAGQRGGLAAATTAGPGEPDVVVREYRHGDDVRKVHWRSTARRDELMVRTEEPPAGSRTTVLLDHRASAHRGKGAAASLEWTVSFAASACARLGQGGQRFRLLAADGTVLVEESSNRGPGAQELMLDSLARLTRSPARELCIPHEPGRRLIAVLGALLPAAAEAVARSRPAGQPGLAVLLDIEAWGSGSRRDGGRFGAAAAALREAGWVVVRAGPGDDPARVWRELLGSAAQNTAAPAGRG